MEVNRWNRGSSKSIFNVKISAKDSRDSAKISKSVQIQSAPPKNAVMEELKAKNQENLEIINMIETFLKSPMATYEANCSDQKIKGEFTSKSISMIAELSKRSQAVDPLPDNLRKGFEEIANNCTAKPDLKERLIAEGNLSGWRHGGFTGTSEEGKMLFGAFCEKYASKSYS